MTLTENDQILIEKQIAEIEKCTIGEIVPVVVFRSSPRAIFEAYLLTVLFIFGLFLVWAYDHFSTFPVSLHQAILFLACFTLLTSIVFFLPSVQKFLIKKDHLAKYVHNRAILEFVKEGLINTDQRTGVLIMISLFERRIQILADVGIHSCVDQSEWKKIADLAAKSLSNKNVYQALKDSIEQVGLLLIKHKPVSDINPDELSDRVRIKK